MQTRSRGDYTIAGRELVAEGTDLRVQVLSLSAGQCVPWHYHTEISDSFVCLEGPMVVETRAPRHVYRLVPGERCLGIGIHDSIRNAGNETVGELRRVNLHVSSQPPATRCR